MRISTASKGLAMRDPVTHDHYWPGGAIPVVLRQRSARPMPMGNAPIVAKPAQPMRVAEFISRKYHVAMVRNGEIRIHRGSN